MKLKDNVLLKLNSLEFGFLFGTLRKGDEFDNLPRSLQLKLQIKFTEAYTKGHPMQDQAKEDIKNYKAELKRIEAGEQKPT